MNSGARMTALSEERSGAGQAGAKREPAIQARGSAFGKGNRTRSASAPPLLRHNSRRLFLKTGVTSLGAIALWIMNNLARRAESIPEDSESILTVPWSPAQPVHFHEQMIVVNGAEGVAVLSSQCPHLGCRINRTEGKELACPCHGSRFNLQGDVVHGPATRGLRSLSFALDRTKGVLRVSLVGNQS